MPVPSTLSGISMGGVRAENETLHQRANGNYAHLGYTQFDPSDPGGTQPNAFTGSNFNIIGRDAYTNSHNSLAFGTSLYQMSENQLSDYHTQQGNSANLSFTITNPMTGLQEPTYYGYHFSYQAYTQAGFSGETAKHSDPNINFYNLINGANGLTPTFGFGHTLGSHGDYDEMITFLAAAGCFPADALIETKRAGVIPISELMIGDYVMTAKGWSKMFAWMHYDVDSNIEYDYLKIIHEKGELFISPGHIMLINNDWIDCSLAKIGDTIQFENNPVKILSIENTKQKKAYSPITRNVELLVEGVTVSCVPDAKTLPSHRISKLWSILVFQPLNFLTFNIFGRLIAMPEPANNYTGLQLIIFIIGWIMGRIPRTKFKIKRIKK